MTEPVCPLCDRPIPKGVPQSSHHLVPKVKGGRHEDTVLLHHQCYKEIHTTLSRTEPPPTKVEGISGLERLQRTVGPFSTEVIQKA